MAFRCVLWTLLLLGKLKACYSEVTTDLPYSSSAVISYQMYKEIKGNLSSVKSPNLALILCSFNEVLKTQPVTMLMIAILQDVSLTFYNYILLNLTQEKKTL